MDFQCQFCGEVTNFEVGWVAQWFAMLQNTVGCPACGSITEIPKAECLLFTTFCWRN